MYYCFQFYHFLAIPTIYHGFIYASGVDVKKYNIYHAALIALMTFMSGAYLANGMTVLWIFVEATTLAVAALIRQAALGEALDPQVRPAERVADRPVDRAVDGRRSWPGPRTGPRRRARSRRPSGASGAVAPRGSARRTRTGRPSAQSPSWASRAMSGAAEWSARRPSWISSRSRPSWTKRTRSA